MPNLLKALPLRARTGWQREACCGERVEEDFLEGGGMSEIGAPIYL